MTRMVVMLGWMLGCQWGVGWLEWVAGEQYTELSGDVGSEGQKLVGGVKPLSVG